MADRGYGGTLRPSGCDARPLSNGLGGQMSRDNGRGGQNRGPFYEAQTGKSGGYESHTSSRGRSEETIYRGLTEENGPRGHTGEPARSYEGHGYGGQLDSVGIQQNSGSPRTDDYTAGLFNARVQDAGKAVYENYYPRDGSVTAT